LPNPRDLSCQLHTDTYEIDQNVTHMFMQWGQLINHDITSLSVTKPEERDLGICRTCTRTDKCMPMPINRNASCTCTTNMRHDCIEFTRSSAAFGDTACQSPVRDHINLQTPYLDASFVYGIDAKELELLRDRSSGAKGLFLVQPNGLLPKDMTEKPSDCLDFTHEKRCFKAGDERVNQNPGLMSMHTIFVREHNRIANILSQLNPSWEDLTVFEETRKIVSAIFQHISYNEFMRTLFGEPTAKMMGLLPGDFTYDPNVDPRITEEVRTFDICLISK
jgi:peroxidase